MSNKKTARLFLISVIISILVLSIVPFRTLDRAYALSAAKVTVTPDVVGQKAEYTITFTISQNLYVGDNIFIVFPSDTLIPCSTCNPYIAAGNFTVNNVTPTEDIVANTGARTLWIKSPVSASAGGTVVVDIRKGARIANPTHPGEYQLQVATTNESYYVLSEPYKIEYSKVSNVSVQLSSSIIDAQSEYTVSFNTGVLGGLSTGIDSIFIKFPDEVVLPKTIYSNRVSLNSEKGALRIKVQNNTMQLIVLKDIKAGSSITIDFTYNFGIHNPHLSGHYPIVVWTSEEDIHVPSYFDITDKPEVQTSFIVTPSIPDGKDGWFLTQPVVVLIGISNVSGAVSVYYSLDDSNNFSLYSSPITIPNGEHTLYYYSVNTAQGLQEKVKSKVFKTDTVEPSIQVNIQDGAKVNKVNFTVSGKVESQSTSSLLLNGHKVKLNDDGSFSVDLLLSEGNNNLTFDLEDEAGHKVVKNFSIFVDSVPPKLEVSSPTLWQKITSPDVEVKGKTDPDAHLTINNKDVPVNADGTFSYELTFSEQGVYTIKVIASDDAGNTTVKAIPIEYKKAETVQITLQIGNKTALLNGKPVILDSAPFIDTKTNRTLVPLRFIAEAFKAEVQWNSSLRTVTINGKNKSIVLQIGNGMAVVNGKSISLDQPPVIENGRTMVPIRFISEILGATVKWVPENKSIIITYVVG